MMKRADQLMQSQISSSYDFLPGKCDQFLKDVLIKGDPAAANLMHLLPLKDINALIDLNNGNTESGSAPQGFKQVPQ